MVCPNEYNPDYYNLGFSSCWEWALWSWASPTAATVQEFMSFALLLLLSVERTRCGSEASGVLTGALTLTDRPTDRQWSNEALRVWPWEGIHRIAWLRASISLYNQPQYSPLCSSALDLSKCIMAADTLLHASSGMRSVTANALALGGMFLSFEFSHRLIVKLKARQALTQISTTQHIRDVQQGE